MKDFPAAHSMDSEWFAVDAKGQIAIFDTGEPGPIPEEAWADQGLQYEVAPWLARLGLSYNLSDVTFPDAVFCGHSDWGANADQAHELEPSRIYGGHWLLWLTSPQALPPGGLEGGHAIKLNPAPDEPMIVVYGEFEPETLFALRDQGVLFRALSHDLRVTRFSVFGYEYEDYSGDSPYVRTRVPAQPLTVGDVPEELRTRMSQMTFPDLDFGAAETLEPRDYTECHGWY